MDRQGTRRDLFNRLQALKREEARFFCEEESYCESVGCNGYEDCEHCDDGYNDDLDICGHCIGGTELHYCEAHEGGVLSVEPDGDEFLVVLCAGGPLIELSTREYALIGHWWDVQDRVKVDNDVVNEVRAYWREIQS